MARIALGVEYDGSHFKGWQMQSHGTRTVQDVLQQALEKVADHSVVVTCAGRTDTGVHATGQVVHFDTQVDRETKAWVMGGNTHLPNDTCVHWAKIVDDDFSARFSATQRVYRYVILNRTTRSALYDKRVSWIYEALDVPAMHRAAQALVGEQDFSAFRSSACQAKHATRNMEYIQVSKKDRFITIDIRANAFLHHMVRNIVGTLLMVGRGEQAEGWIKTLLEQQDRTLAGPTAVADGLYLVAVEYPQHYAIPLNDIRPVFS